ncbi:MAG TPA: CUAEP/CCAEP-tail radical SAM protein, partial [Thermomicrobiales bacterium]|nr:CUAEP/CCAEP-tail radical SAM protein [Thermomicrobiales bacterium]
GHITFGDPDFLNGPTHALRICRALHEEFPRVTFDFTARIEHLLQHRDLLPEFRELGCVFVLTAVETISSHILEKLDKGHTKQDVIDALSAMDAAGITMRPSLLPFTPWTTLDDYRDLLAFFAEYDLAGSVDPVHFSIRLLVPPGSALLDQPDTDDWLGPLDAANFTYTWRNPDPRVDDLQRQVAALVERAARDGENPDDSFAAITALAWSITGDTPPPTTPRRVRLPGESPRLTESWFC